MHAATNDPLHGITLKKIVEDLVEYYGWEELGEIINIDCFNFEPSVKSSLKFIRRTNWARKKVNRLYLQTFHPLETEDDDDSLLMDV